MKKTRLTRCQFATVLLIAGSFGRAATAQQTTPKSTSPNDVHVRIIERNGDQVREIERTYRMDGLSDPERDKLVTRLVDSLKATRSDGGKRRMTIIVEDNDGNRTDTRLRTTPGNRLNGDAYVQRGRLPRLGNDSWNNQNWSFEFRRGADSLADQLKRFQYQFPRDFDQQLVRPFQDWSRNFSAGTKPSTIRGLEAYANNPDRNQLTVRFTAPAKGNVLIVVTNPIGKEVARRDVKDFSGEFVGQLDLGKNPQGAYFITVTQNQDGAVKRILID